MELKFYNHHFAPYPLKPVREVELNLLPKLSITPSYLQGSIYDRLLRLAFVSKIWAQ